MKISRSLALTAVLIIAVLVSGAAAILAQTPAATSQPSGSSFGDGRINGDIDLGGLALYCYDASGNTRSVNTFQNGGITVWGVGGQKYIDLTAAQLRGNMEIPQMMATAEAGATAEATAMMQPTMMSTPMAGSTAEATSTAPILLARAATTNGEVFFISLGNDNFELQGTDNTGKSFGYFWSGCSMGNIQAGAVPVFPMGTPGASNAQATAMMTAEATTSP